MVRDSVTENEQKRLKIENIQEIVTSSKCSADELTILFFQEWGFNDLVSKNVIPNQVQSSSYFQFVDFFVHSK